MLGFDVSIYSLKDDGERQLLAKWPAYNLAWIQDLLKQGRAELIQDSGGYPNVYGVLAGEIRALFAGKQSRDLDRLLARRPDLSRNQQSHQLAMIRETGRLESCPENAKLIVEAWDQS